MKSRDRPIEENLEKGHGVFTSSSLKFRVLTGDDENEHCVDFAMH